MPLLLAHGWPGSVVEFHRLLPMLTDPARFGTDPADALTVVAPRRCRATRCRSLRGRGASASVGDWGTSVASRMGWAFADQPDRHLPRLAGRRATQFERDRRSDARGRSVSRTTGALAQGKKPVYQWIQGTQPTTLAYGLTDSPARLAAWIVEKFYTWTDHDGSVESAIGRDEMPANITLCPVTGAIGSSLWPYHACLHQPWLLPEGKRIEVPTGSAAFPGEILRPPRSVAERSYADIRRWTTMDKGGHFAALEQP